MVAIISSLSQTAIKTLNFFIQFLHRHPLRHHTAAAASSGDTTPANDLFSQFLQISKKFPKRNPNTNPIPKLPEPHRPLQYNALMSSFNRSNNPTEVLRLFRQLKDSIFFQPNLLIYTTAIDALVKSNRFQEAEDLFQEMMDSGIIPDATCCTILIKMYSSHLKQFSWAYGVIGWMVQCGIRPDVVTYCTLISGLCEAGRIDEALHVLAVDMKKLNCEPNLFCYGTAFKALVSVRRYGEAEDLFWEAMRSGVTPDVKFCTELVKMYSFDLEKFESAREVVRWMVKSVCKPDVVMYSTLINGLCRAGRVEEAREVVDEMVKEKCEPNCITFTPLLQAYCSKGRIEEAKRLLDSMESGNCSPDTVCYNVLIQGFCDKGDFDEVENVLRESSSKGWNPDAVSYNSYINGLCKVSRIEEAFRQLEVMLGKGLCPTVITLNILLDRLCCESRVWDVKRLLERSSELDLDLDVVSYNTVMNRLCEVEEWFTVLKILLIW